MAASTAAVPQQQLNSFVDDVKCSKAMDKLVDSEYDICTNANAIMLISLYTNLASLHTTRSDYVILQK